MGFKGFAVFIFLFSSQAWCGSCIQITGEFDKLLTATGRCLIQSELGNREYTFFDVIAHRDQVSLSTTGLKKRRMKKVLSSLETLECEQNQDQISCKIRLKSRSYWAEVSTYFQALYPNSSSSFTEKFKLAAGFKTYSDLLVLFNAIPESKPEAQIEHVMNLSKMIADDSMAQMFLSYAFERMISK